MGCRLAKPANMQFAMDEMGRPNLWFEELVTSSRAACDLGCWAAFAKRVIMLNLAITCQVRELPA